MATETSNYQGNPTFLCVIRKLEWMDSSCQGQGDYKLLSGLSRNLSYLNGDGWRGGLNEIMNLYFTFECCNSINLLRYACRYKNLLKLNMHQRRSILKEDTKNQPLRFAFSEIRRTWSFHVVVLPRTAKKCTRVQNARAEPSFCSVIKSFVW